jgi:hypothetical protein
VTPYSLVEVYRRLGGTYCFFQDRGVSQGSNQLEAAAIRALLKMHAVRSSDTSANLYQATCFHIPEHSTLRNHENLKSNEKIDDCFLQCHFVNCLTRHRMGWACEWSTGWGGGDMNGRGRDVVHIEVLSTIKVFWVTHILRWHDTLVKIEINAIICIKQEIVYYLRSLCEPEMLFCLKWGGST